VVKFVFSTQKLQNKPVRTKFGVQGLLQCAELGPDQVQGPWKIFKMAKKLAPHTNVKEPQEIILQSYVKHKLCYFKLFIT